MEFDKQITSKTKGTYTEANKSLDERPNSDGQGNILTINTLVSNGTWWKEVIDPVVILSKGSKQRVN